MQHNCTEAIEAAVMNALPDAIVDRIYDRFVCTSEKFVF